MKCTTCSQEMVDMESALRHPAMMSDGIGWVYEHIDCSIERINKTKKQEHEIHIQLIRTSILVGGWVGLLVYLLVTKLLR